MKYTFPNVVNGTNDAFTNILIDTNNAMSGWLIYLFLVLVFIVSIYVAMKRTNDIPKSATTSLYITTVLTIIIYYYGKVAQDVTTGVGANFVGESIFVSVILVFIGALTYTYYQNMGKT